MIRNPLYLLLGGVFAALLGACSTQPVSAQQTQASVQAAINASINSNGVQAITGPVLNGVLTTMNSAIFQGPTNLSLVTNGSLQNSGLAHSSTIVNGQACVLGSTCTISGASSVTSVFGRTGAVIAQSGDYTFSQITGLPTTLAGYGITSPLPIAQGGSGTTTPSLVGGTNVTITGTWPNQTVTATGSGGGVNSGTLGSAAYYASTGSTVSGSSKTTSNVVWFGADSTGVSDSTSAFNSALASAKDVYVPCGTYKINITISVAAGSLHGSPCVTLTANNTAVAVITNTGSNFEIRGVGIWGSSNSGSGIKITAGNLYMRDLVISGFNYDVECRGADLSGNVLTNSVLLDAGTANVYWGGCNDSIISNNSIGDSLSQGTVSSSIGIDMEDAQANNVSSNFIWGHTVGIVNGTSSSGNYYNNNRITQSYYQGAYCSGASYTNWTNNQFYDNSNIGAGSYPHLHFQSSCTNAVVTGNNFFNAVLVGGTNTSYSVAMNTGNNYIIVTANNMTNNTIAGFVDSGTGNVTTGNLVH